MQNPSLKYFASPFNSDSQVQEKRNIPVADKNKINPFPTFLEKKEIRKKKS